MQKPWFRTKQYGWGWVPATWQGWFIILVYMIIALADGLTLSNQPSTSEWWQFSSCIVLATVVLIWICYRTGEKPRWRWGK
jgi:hypothetical protein